MYSSLVIRKLKTLIYEYINGFQQGLKLVRIEAQLKKYTSINANIVTKIQFYSTYFRIVKYETKLKKSENKFSTKPIVVAF